VKSNLVEIGIAWPAPARKIGWGTMYIRRLCIATLSILSMLYATAAHAQSSPIGDASSVQNQVEGIVNRKAQPLSSGGSVFQNERVHTGDDSQAQLVFLDSTDLGVGPKSEVTLDRFVYNPDRGTGRVQIEANRGVFRFVTGSQDKKDYEIVTPSGTIHVKGTEFQLLVDKSLIIVALESGALTVTTNRGRVVGLDQPGTSLTVHKDGRVEGPTPFSGTITKYANAQFPDFVSALPPAVNILASFSFTGCYAGAQTGVSQAFPSFNNIYTDESTIGSPPLQGTLRIRTTASQPAELQGAAISSALSLSAEKSNMAMMAIARAELAIPVPLARGILLQRMSSGRP
jgi:hypothetical protein